MPFLPSRRRRDSARPAAPEQATRKQTRELPLPPPTPEERDHYTPRRRYPWHDDPDYDPSAHRRIPPPQTPAQPQPARGVASGTLAAENATNGTFAPPEPTREQRYPREGTTGHMPPPPPPPGVANGTFAAENATRVPFATRQAATAAPTTATQPEGKPGPRIPSKITVTRVAAMRSKQFAQGGVRAWHRATRADGADRSGLTALTYTTMMDYAADAAVAVALANTLFFAAATAESKTNVALYLAITVAPFAVVAPVIGPLLDRLQRGRRAAMATSFVIRGVLAVVMALNYDTWLLYPAALGALVASKSCTVLKAAITPRVLPSAITLTTTNSRLTVFGLIAGGVFGAIAAGIGYLAGSPGALYFTAVICVAGVVACLRIPKWVESTAGEVPAVVRSGKRDRMAMGKAVVVALWGNGAIRILTGFLTLYVAFVVKSQPNMDATHQLTMIGIVGGAAGIGAFAGNAAGSRMRFGRSDSVVIACIAAAVVVAAVAALLPGIATAAVVGLVAATVSALAKVCLDAVIQRDLPEESRASAFGRSETVLQLAWVFGGALGVLLPHDGYVLGFSIVAGVVALAGAQTALVASGRSIVPFLRHRPAPDRPTARVGS